MSRTLNLLNKARETTTSKYSLVQCKEPTTTNTTRSKISIPWLLGLMFTVMFIVNLALAVRFFVMVKDRDSVHLKLASIEEQLRDNLHQLSLFTSDLRQMRADIATSSAVVKSVDTKLSRFDQMLESQQFTIDNLNKAKNALYNRLSSIEGQTKSQ